MKKTTRIIALIMTLALLLSSVSLLAFAKSESDVAADEEYVATIYVCQMGRQYNLNGHTWVYFKNLTNHSIMVGVYSLPKGQGVTVGTFGYSIVDGKGLYYNAESYRYNKEGTSDFVCLKKNLTKEQLDQTSIMITQSGFWSYLTNCSYSAFNIWNVTPQMPLTYLILPFFARLSILLYTEHEGGFKMYVPKLSQVYKQVGYGDDAYLIPADPSVPKD